MKQLASSNQMQVKIEPIKHVTIYNFEYLTKDQFINLHHTQESFAWCDGYLMNYSHFGSDIFDEEIKKGNWCYRAVSVAEMKKYEPEIQTRFVKIPVFDMSGSTISHVVADYAKSILLNAKV